MSRTYDFLLECGTFFIATISGSAPAVRPFGAIIELKGELYFSTANTKDVYAQLTKNPNVQITALKTGTRNWIRISGKAVEIHNIYIKQKMLDAYPVLLMRFDSKYSETFAVFKITEMISALNINGEFEDLS